MPKVRKKKRHTLANVECLNVSKTVLLIGPKFQAKIRTSSGVCDAGGGHLYNPHLMIKS